MTKIMLSNKNQSYWNNNGLYQETYHKLYEELVPDRGCAETLAGEMLRASSRLYHEYFNNGNMNAIDEQFIDDDEEVALKIDCFYKKFIKLLNESFAMIFSEFKDESKNMREVADTVQEIESIILSCNPYSGCSIKEMFSDRNEAVYNHMADYTTYFVSKYKDFLNKKLSEVFPYYEKV